MKRKLWRISQFLLVAGAINWGLVGLLELNLIEAILGTIPILESIVYVLIGISGLWTLKRYT